MTVPRTILHPTDFSGNSARAFLIAAELARDGNARVLALHVSPLPLTTLGGTTGVPPSREEFDVTEARKKLAALKAPAGVTVETRLEIGDAAEAISRVARETDCELIVMGTHGRGGLRRLLVGSVAEQVLRHAPCPVLTLREGAK